MSLLWLSKRLHVRRCSRLFAGGCRRFCQATSKFLPQSQTRLQYLFHPLMIQRFCAPFACYYLRQCERRPGNPLGTSRIAASRKGRERTNALTKHYSLGEVVRSHIATCFYHFHLIMPGKSLQSLYVCASKSNTQERGWTRILSVPHCLGIALGSL